MKKAAQVKQVENVKRIADLRKSKQDLLDKQLTEQKNLIAKIEAKKENGEEMKPEERSTIMKIIKVLGDSIVKTKDELQKMVFSSTVKMTPAEVSVTGFRRISTHT